MPGTAASHLIFFIAALVVSAVAVGVVFQATDNLRQGIEDKSGGIVDSLRRDIDIINDEAAMPYNATNSTLTLYVLNTGKDPLVFPAGVAVLINGTAANNVTMYVQGGTVWAPQTVLTLVVGNMGLPTGMDHRAKVIAHGTDDAIAFRL